jgi:hypothetical protein
LLALLLVMLLLLLYRYGLLFYEIFRISSSTTMFVEISLKFRRSMLSCIRTSITSNSSIN